MYNNLPVNKRADLVDISKAAIIFSLYVLGGRYGLTLDAVGGFATLVWLPTGISIAALILLGKRFWWAIYLGAFVVNFTNGANFLVSAGIAGGNTLESIVALAVLRRLDFQKSLKRLDDVLALISSSLIGTLISATVGTTALVFGNIVGGQNVSLAWLSWWVGDMLSVLIVTPLILLWSNLKIKKFDFSRSVEGGALTILVLVVGLVVFADFRDLIAKDAPILYFIYPILIWVALRFGPREVVGVTFIVSTIAIFGTVSGFGPFLRPTLGESLLYLQGFMGVTAVTSLILSAVVSERKAAEARKDDFISIASHELRTPLTTVSSYVELLEKMFASGENPKARNYLVRMRGQVKRLSSLVYNLLDVSKIQSGKLELKKEEFSLNKLVGNIVEDMQRQSLKHKIFLEDKEKVRIFADKGRISQVVENLVSNAIKYSPKADKIFVRIDTQDNKTLFSVEDFGIGIEFKNKKLIFNRFFQAETRVRPSFSGLGLGLYVCREIIKAHKGSIWVKSQKGKGSTFFVSLPKE